MQVVICHHPENIDFLASLLLTMKDCPYDYHIFTNPRNDSGYEMAALKYASTLNDDIVFLQDSCEIKDIGIFRMLAEATGGIGICKNFNSYIGKYKGEILCQMNFPMVKSKEEAITQEGIWTRDYIHRDPDFRWFHQLLKDNPKREEKFGRMNMVLENDYMKKFKATFR